MSDHTVDKKANESAINKAGEGSKQFPLDLDGEQYGYAVFNTHQDCFVDLDFGHQDGLTHVPTHIITEWDESILQTIKRKQGLNGISHLRVVSVHLHNELDRDASEVVSAESLTAAPPGWQRLDEDDRHTYAGHFKFGLKQADGPHEVHVSEAPTGEWGYCFTDEEIDTDGTEQPRYEVTIRNIETNRRVEKQRGFVNDLEAAKEQAHELVEDIQNSDSAQE
jgi:hypothetical protein